MFAVDDSVVVTAGRWICCSNGWRDFKIDKSRMGRCMNCRMVTRVRQLEEMVLSLLGLEKKGIYVELSYWFDDILARVNGVEISPSVI